MAPVIRAILAFNLGPPGALIKREKFGLMNAAKPKIITMGPVIIRIVFVNPTFSPCNHLYNHRKLIKFNVLLIMRLMDSFIVRILKR